MVIQLEDLLAHQAQKKLWNSKSLGAIKLFNGSEPIEIRNEQIEHYEQFCGFSVIDCIKEIATDNDISIDVVLPDTQYKYTTPPVNVSQAADIVMTALSPANFEDLITCDSHYTSLEILKISNIVESFALGKKSELTLWFVQHEIYHQDDMGLVIAKEVFNRIKGIKSIDIEQESVGFGHYWRRQGRDIKTEMGW